jgi:predicted acylesterase/phospholipase RssA
MAETDHNYSPLAPAISPLPPDERRRARAAESSPHLGGSQLPATANRIRAATRPAPGFFTPRLLAPWLYPPGTIAATSAYDTSSLKATLEELIDFDRLDAGTIRFSISAVNVRTGNFVYFDTRTHTIGPEHIMASGALPPDFPQ